MSENARLIREQQAAERATWGSEQPPASIGLPVAKTVLKVEALTPTSVTLTVDGRHVILGLGATLTLTFDPKPTLT